MTCSATCPMPRNADGDSPCTPELEKGTAAVEQEDLSSALGIFPSCLSASDQCSLEVGAQPKPVVEGGNGPGQRGTTAGGTEALGAAAG